MLSPSSDKIFLAVVLILVGFGIIMVYSTSGVLGGTQGDGRYFLLRHLFSLLVGFLAMVVAAVVPYEFFRRPGVILPLLFFALALLSLTLIPNVGMKINNARRWLPIGSFRTFQPSEVAKVIVVLYFAQYLVKKQEKIKSFSFTVLPSLLILTAFFLLIVAQPDLGTAINIALLVLAMLFFAGVRLSHLCGVFLVIISAISALAWINPYQKTRMLLFLNPWQDPRGTGYQLIQSLIAIAKGGIAGVGLGQGEQKLFYLPEPYSDFIFATIGEELGFLGAVVLVALFTLLIWRGMLIAFRAPDLFGAFTAFGLTLLIGLQAIINLGVVTGLLPTKGLPLPFISHGGTSLAVCLFASGIILNISKYAPAVQRRIER
jgi:cell division protein FtsW